MAYYTSLVLTLAIQLIGFTACRTPSSYSQAKQVQGEDVSVVLGLIHSCPSFFEITGREAANDKLVLESLQAHLKQIAKYNLTVIRIAVSEYQKEKLNSRAFHSREKSRLFLLNRYIFNVPPGISLDSMPPQIGWRLDGIPNANLLWPLSVIDEQGNITLDVGFVVYTGQYYSPLEEFDYFNERFGLRKIKPGLVGN